MMTTTQWTTINQYVQNNTTKRRRADNNKNEDWKMGIPHMYDFLFETPPHQQFPTSNGNPPHHVTESFSCETATEEE